MKKIKNLLRRIYTINIIYSNNIIFIHRKNTKNIGDLNCCPNKYFDELSKYKSIDIMDLQNINIKIKNKILIVGGGGLFQPYFEDAIKTLEKLSLENKIIYWGTGIDKNIQGETINLDFLNKSSLIGTSPEPFNRLNNLRLLIASSQNSGAGVIYGMSNGCCAQYNTSTSGRTITASGFSASRIF